LPPRSVSLGSEHVEGVRIREGLGDVVAGGIGDERMRVGIVLVERERVAAAGDGAAGAQGYAAVFNAVGKAAVEAGLADARIEGAPTRRIVDQLAAILLVRLAVTQGGGDAGDVGTAADRAIGASAQRRAFAWSIFWLFPRFE
jgi:hypothetical protein